MFLAIFVKKSFFFRVKKKFDGIFFAEVSKKNKKLLYQMKVGMYIGKVKKFGIDWCIPHRMTADIAKGGGSGQTSNRVKGQKRHLRQPIHSEGLTKLY